jgi:hypothetical protein
MNDVGLITLPDGGGHLAMAVFTMNGARSRATQYAIAETAGGVTVNGIAKWNGSSWSALGSGVIGTVNALAVYDDGAGPALYAGGSFASAGGVAASRIAKWDGSSWSALGGGITTGALVYALTVFDDGGGPALYAGGAFTGAGGVSANHVARWDGSSWSPLGSGVSGFRPSIRALAAYDDGGPALYVGGRSRARAAERRRIALMPELVKPGSPVSGVLALTVHDDGGPALFAGGTFTTMGGIAANRIARWDGSSWSAVGSGMDKAVFALTVHDDGSGPALFAGGDFTAAGGVESYRIARWSGSSWSRLGHETIPNVYYLTEYDDGGGSALYAAGAFTSPGGPANRIARWDGASWAPLGSGMNNDVNCLAVYDDGSGPNPTPEVPSGLRAARVRAGSPGGMARAGPRWAAESTSSSMRSRCTTTGSGRRSTPAATSPAPEEPPRTASRSGTARAGRRSAAE